MNSNGVGLLCCIVYICYAHTPIHVCIIARETDAYRICDGAI